MPSGKNIAAMLTPPGRSALATLGILGPDAVPIAQRLFEPRFRYQGSNLPFDRPLYGYFGTRARDDVVLHVSSTSSPPEVLLHAHGGPAIVQELLEAIGKCGAFTVPWQEYLLERGESEIKVECMEALAKATTARTAALLLDQYNGALERAFLTLEASHDPRHARRLLSWSALGSHLVTGWRLLLLGPANAGKSSLLNALVGFRRANVSNVPGTTRDVIAGETAFDGWPVRILDGPGIRESSDPIEREGMNILESTAPSADLRLLVLDTSTEFEPEWMKLWKIWRPNLVIGNKSDLPCPWREKEKQRLSCVVSARSGDGIGALMDLIVKRLVPCVPDEGEAIPFHPRQIDWLKKYLAVEPASKEGPTPLRTDSMGKDPFPA